MRSSSVSLRGEQKPLRLRGIGTNWKRGQQRALSIALAHLAEQSGEG